MENCLKQSSQESLEPGNSERFWALYWHKAWQAQTDDLAIAHISAYLQEVCYWVSRKMSLNLSAKQSPADLFQTAIARIHKVLKGFNPQFSSNLKSYAEFTFSNIIKDTLRQSQQADICTDWALLRKITQKRLVESLEYAGMDKSQISSYVLAWTCYKELYAPAEVGQTRKLVKPEPATWQAIARLYNAERMSQLTPGGAECSPERLEQWLLSCAKAVRGFLYPTPVSIDAPTSAAEDSTSIADKLPADEQDSLLSELVQQEEADQRKEQQTEVGQVLIDAIATLDPQSQQILIAYYREGQTQQEIAQSLDIQQYTVSRRLTSARKVVLKKLAQWSQGQLHISLTSDVLNSMSAVLDEWLSTHYRHSNISSL